MADEYQSVLLVIRECFVYKLPPRSSSKEYRAAEWGDMEAFLWKGRLRIIAIGEKCFIRLEDGTTGELFAESPYDPKTNSVEPVRDSSRYFVLRVEDKGRHAFIGMGFQERSEAFDFQVTLQDHIKHLNVEKEAAERSKITASNPKDYSLKEGQTISITIGNKQPPKGSKGPEETLSSTDVPLLPPPPSVTSRKKRAETTPKEFDSFNNFSGFMDSTDSFG
ncbi:hypothetical protein G9A89_013612 [Geosiphon pyriformis]|nr:hypothetical protein G9A89_013612 [Geosiphon pyriformis]